MIDQRYQMLRVSDLTPADAALALEELAQAFETPIRTGIMLDQDPARKLVSIVTPCYNEEENVEEVYRRVKEVFDSLGAYRYEHIFIDNASTDRTVGILRRLAASGQKRQGDRQQPQLRPHPLALPRACCRPAATR